MTIKGDGNVSVEGSLEAGRDIAFCGVLKDPNNQHSSVTHEMLSELTTGLETALHKHNTAHNHDSDYYKKGGNLIVAGDVQIDGRDIKDPGGISRIRIVEGGYLSLCSKSGNSRIKIKSNDVVEIKQRSWNWPSLRNNWKRHDNNAPMPGYLKDAQGFVHLRGVVSGGSANTTIFYIDDSYKPLGGSLIYLNAGYRGNNSSIKIVEITVGIDNKWAVRCDSGDPVNLDGLVYPSND